MSGLLHSASGRLEDGASWDFQILSVRVKGSSRISPNGST